MCTMRMCVRSVSEISRCNLAKGQRYLRHDMFVTGGGLFLAMLVHVGFESGFESASRPPDLPWREMVPQKKLRKYACCACLGGGVGRSA